MKVPKELVEQWKNDYLNGSHEAFMAEYIAQRAAEWAVSQPVSMEPVAYSYDLAAAWASKEVKLYTAAQLAAARLQGAEEVRVGHGKWIAELESMVNVRQQRIAELEVEVKRTSLTMIQRECLRIGEEVQRAAGELPDGYDIHIEIERGAGAVYLSNPSYDVTHFNDTVDGISHCITQAIDAAIAKVKP